MIGIPSEFAPSSLLHYEQVSPEVQRLLKESRTARLEYEWMQAHNCALDAYEICILADAHVGLALAQIHLVDFYSEVGELGQAMERCENARQTLRRQTARAQRHNEAVAAYALGLLHELQLFSDSLGAWHWYQEALQEFKVAQEHWAKHNNISWVETCQKTRQWIKGRSDRIMESRINQSSREVIDQAAEASVKRASEQRDQAELSRLRQILATRFSGENLRTLCFDLSVDYDDLPAKGKENKARELVTYLAQRGRIPELVRIGERLRPDIPWGDTLEVTKEASSTLQSPSYEGLPWRAVFAIWRLDSAGTPFARGKDEDLQGYIMDDNRVLIKGTSYHLHPISAHSGSIPAISTGEVNYYFALPVPEDRWAVPETRTGDYVFIRQQWLVDEESMGVVWEPGSGWGAVDFRRECDDKVRFYHRYPKIIGGVKSKPGDPAGKVKGYIIALLKPEE